MSFSNTDTGAKPADPYVQKNLDEPTLADKVDGLIKFVEKNKFCLLTTQTPDGLLASRCMALAGKVRAYLSSCDMLYERYTHDKGNRRTMASTSSSTPTPSPARPTTSRRTRM